MINKIPVRLKKEPLLEAVWEIRFTSTNQSVAELLPGLIYKSLSVRYPNIVRLPVADIPSIVTESNPLLRYAPKIRFEGDNQAIQIGDHILSLSIRRPYIGWKLFSAEIINLIGVIRETKLIEHVERFSLKYIDLISLKHPPDLECLNVELKIGGHEINDKPVQLRTEINDEELLHIIQIVSPADATLPSDPQKFSGVLLDIDTICVIKEQDSWNEVGNRLDSAHSASKKLFFNLLTGKTIEDLDPEYQE